jgi:hypothetical protein
MRWTKLALVAAAGIVASAFAAPAGAFTPTSSAGLSPAAQAVDPIASVHCRSFKHRSPNHGWGFGCRGAGVGVSVHRRGFVEEREGRRGGRVGVHERSSTRSSTSVRSRESTSARGEVKTGTSRSSTTGKSGTTGNRSETGRGSGGGGGTGSGGGTGGQSSGGNR